jgi:glycerol uptake facilitator-like aquaporin
VLRVLAAELAGTAFLLTAVVGSGIMGDRLSGGNVAVALLANSLATGAALYVLIQIFGPISGAHFNPAVTLTDNSLSRGVALAYVGAQIAGALLGVVVAHVMFSVPAAFSTHIRAGWAQSLSEVVATFGLLIVIRNCQPAAIPVAVAAYITSAYWFTSSTSFANPAVTVARAFTNTFTGIRPLDVPMFVFAQGVGAVGAKAFSAWLRR